MDMHDYFLVFPIFVVAFEVFYCLTSGSKKEKKNKKETNEWGKKGIRSLNPLKVTSAGGRGSCHNQKSCINNARPIFFCISQLRSSNQKSEHRSLLSGGQGPLPTLTPTSWVQAAPVMLAWLPAGAGEWRMVSCCCSKSWIGLKLTGIYHPRLLLEDIDERKF